MIKKDGFSQAIKQAVSGSKGQEPKQEFRYVTDLLKAKNLGFESLLNKTNTPGTGSGKSFAVAQHAKAGNNTILLVPTKTLCKQVAAEFGAEVWFGDTKATTANMSSKFIVSTYNSAPDLFRNLKQLGTLQDYDLFLDEAHTIASDSYKKTKLGNSIFYDILPYLKEFKTYTNLTATPRYLTPSHPLNLPTNKLEGIKSTSVKTCKIIDCQGAQYNEHFKLILNNVGKRFIFLHLNDKGDKLQFYKDFLNKNGISYECLNSGTKDNEAFRVLESESKVLEGVQVYICTDVVREGVSIINVPEALVICCKRTNVIDIEQIANRFRKCNIELIITRSGDNVKSTFFDADKEAQKLTESAKRTKECFNYLLSANDYIETDALEHLIVTGQWANLHYDSNLAKFEICETSISQKVNKKSDDFILESKYRVQTNLEGFGWSVEHIEGTAQNLPVTKEKTKNYKEVINEVKSVIIENLDVTLCNRGEAAKTKIEDLCSRYGQETIFKALDNIETAQQLTQLKKQLVCLRDKTTKPLALARGKFLGSLIEGKHYNKNEISKLFLEAFSNSLGLKTSDYEGAWALVKNYVQVVQKRKKYTVKFLDFSLVSNQNFTVLKRHNSLKTNELKNDFDFMPLTSTPF